MQTDKGKSSFCCHCNDSVLTYTVIREGRELVCCLYCGLPLEKSGVCLPEYAGREGSWTGTVLYADDSALMREMQKDIFISNRITRDFISVDTGDKLLTVFTKKLLAGEPVALVILDVKMPVLNGINTAIALRAVENALLKKPVPILFFSVKQADDELQKVISHTAPSYYLNKGASIDTKDLEKRMLDALRSILAF